MLTIADSSPESACPALHSPQLEENGKRGRNTHVRRCSWRGSRGNVVVRCLERCAPRQRSRRAIRSGGLQRPQLNEIPLSECPGRREGGHSSVLRPLVRSVTVWWCWNGACRV